MNPQDGPAVARTGSRRAAPCGVDLLTGIELARRGASGGVRHVRPPGPMNGDRRCLMSHPPVVRGTLLWVAVFPAAIRPLLAGAGSRNFGAVSLRRRHLVHGLSQVGNYLGFEVPPVLVFRHAAGPFLVEMKHPPILVMRQLLLARPYQRTFFCAGPCFPLACVGLWLCPTLCDAAPPRDLLASICFWLRSAWL
ncbi:hypothetical protein AHiyo6_09680 [Arthrobacter sp. Hiyo6]|nr:hypothetical protein AHiyo6_09680 [Arthrobacter sp. Hiyo6]